MAQWQQKLSWNLKFIYRGVLGQYVQYLTCARSLKLPSTEVITQRNIKQVYVCCGSLLSQELLIIRTLGGVLKASLSDIFEFNDEYMIKSWFAFELWHKFSSRMISQSISFDEQISMITINNNL